MLDVDGVSLRDDSLQEYLTYLEVQVPETMREIMGQTNRPPRGTLPSTSSANRSHASNFDDDGWHLPDNYTTPGKEPADMIKSGVGCAIFNTIDHHLTYKLFLILAMHEGNSAGVKTGPRDGVDP
jgi:hypothetical protein